MLNISSSKNENGKQYLLINDIKDSKSTYKNSRTHSSLYCKTPEVYPIVLAETFLDLSKITKELDIPEYETGQEGKIRVDVNLQNVRRQKKAEIALTVLLPVEHWSKPWTITEFATEFKLHIEAQNLADIKYDGEIISDGFGIILTTFDIKAPIQTYLDIAKEHVRQAFKIINHTLQTERKEGVLNTLFEFPEELKTSCKQYLIYFGQFLADLGINANTDIKEEANKVLFTITPQDGSEAIEKIREALNVYLTAPGVEGFEDGDNSQDIAMMQWQSNIFHLKSQLALGRALLETKDATIEALKLSNYQLQTFIPKHKKEELENKDEKILGGLATVNNVKLKGVTINLPEILRRLKRRFSK